VKFPEKGLSTMAAVWPSTERVKGGINSEAIDKIHLGNKKASEAKDNQVKEEAL
jgi:hypothetical protein